VADYDAPTAVDTSPRTSDKPVEPALDERYEVRDVLGRGGMGEVRLAHDQRVDREVAIKLMRPEQRDDATIARFFREARIQGRLDHPAVVPVHDLGIDGHGNPFFVMKRLAGTTLADLLRRRVDDPAVRDAWPLGRMLARFADVGLAIELAHTRGVVHRDLKPANIMFGDFGEVYVLDWGIARVLGDDDHALPIAPAPQGTGTEAGALLGTPGYMAPEQIRGEPVDARADVYALGCILYELLTGASALPGGLAALDVALDAPHLRPRDRFPDLGVAPELDALCARATAADPAARPTARELADAIQRYLDGDRDLAMRKELAATHASRAAALLERDDDDSRALATREAGNALALDPSNAVAQGAFARIWLAAPGVVPEAAMAASDRQRAVARVAAMRWVWRGYLGLFALLVALFEWGVPVRHAGPVIAVLVFQAATTVAVWLVTRRLVPMGSPLLLVAMLLNAATIGAGALVLGPLLVMPSFAATSLAVVLAQPTRFRPSLSVAAHGLAVFGPLALEWLGLLPSTYYVKGGAFVLAPWAVTLTPVTTVVIVVGSFAVQLAMVGALAIAQRRTQDDQQDRLHAQSWHLQQLLPQGMAQLNEGPGPRGISCHAP
jgi:serine/threonine-protein kinase